MFAPLAVEYVFPQPVIQPQWLTRRWCLLPSAMHTTKGPPPVPTASCGWWDQQPPLVVGTATTAASSPVGTTTLMSVVNVVYLRNYFTPHATNASSQVSSPNLSSVLLRWHYTKATGASFYIQAMNPVLSCTDGYITSDPYGSAETR